LTPSNKQNIERFKQGDTVHASHIYIAVPLTPGDAEKPGARCCRGDFEAVAAGGRFREGGEEIERPHGGECGPARNCFKSPRSSARLFSACRASRTAM